MYKRIGATQISFYDFNQDLGFQLSEENEWVQLAQNIYEEEGRDWEL